MSFIFHAFWLWEHNNLASESRPINRQWLRRRIVLPVFHATTPVRRRKQKQKNQWNRPRLISARLHERDANKCTIQKRQNDKWKTVVWMNCYFFFFCTKGKSKEKQKRTRKKSWWRRDSVPPSVLRIYLFKFFGEKTNKTLGKINEIIYRSRIHDSSRRPVECFHSTMMVPVF